MLVSSIGYFNALNTVKIDNTTRLQPSSANVFGNDKQNQTPVKNNFASKFLDSFRQIFSSDKSDKSSKYLSLIA